MKIGRVVFDGLEIADADRPRVQHAIEAELTRLIADRGLAPDFTRGGAVPALRAPQITIAPNAKPAQLGAAVAGAVAGGVGGRWR